jgi:NTE family protein
MSTILTMYSIEENVGKTIIGINLGVSLIHETQKSVIFVDLSTGGNGTPAYSMLKLFPPKLLNHSVVTDERIKEQIQIHSSQIFLLTIDPALINEETAASEFTTTLFKYLREVFDYIIVDTASQSNHITYETINISNIVIFMSTSAEHEQPVGILGHQDFRHVINMDDQRVERSPLQNHEYYLLPRDSLTLDTFRRGGIPFVIQSPHRPISRAIARLARDIGKKRLGLVLTGGAALGLTQLGVLEIFERNRIAVDTITGMSFGAFIGAAYALGVELNRLSRHVVKWALSQSYLSWFNSYLFKGSFFKEKSLQALYDTFLKDVYFEELLIPMNVMAFNIRTGKGIIFKEGKVLDAIKSSMRIPGLFVPFQDTEHYLIDGSVLSSRPMVPLKQMRADITIMVHVTPSLGKNPKYFYRKVKGVRAPEHQAAEQNYSIMAATFDSLMEQLIDSPDESPDIERLEPDLVIAPDLKGISWRDFHKVNELIDAGIQVAEKLIPKIEELKWGKKN